MTHPLTAIPQAFHSGKHLGITSVCSAHPIVIEAALRLAKKNGRPALIEATCNQVNQDGGYTGMTPADFRIFVEEIAGRVGLPIENIILGGDHLGPNPWKSLPADEAMAKAEVMIAAFAAAGFTKLHLDCSMGCLGEPVALDDAVTAERAAKLASVAEAHKASVEPVYIIGTEVPVPGGALEELDHLAVTTTDAVAETYSIHQGAFEAAGQDAAFSRVIGMVVQPGVEFGHSDVIQFEPTKAKALTDKLRTMSGIVFEAHSTDYQSTSGLSALVEGGFSILKVGPWLTFALREALYGLDAIADVMDGHAPKNRLMDAMEAIMADKPDNWAKYYEGNAEELFVQRHFSFSDRIRYYWPDQQAVQAVEALRSRIGDKEIPAPLLSQYLPNVSPDSFDGMLIQAVTNVLEAYASATLQ